MDGPNVNWLTFWLLSAQIKAEVHHRLLTVGSCGLHTLHDAFRWEETGWDVQHVLSAIYWLFKDTPSRRKDYTRLTGSSLFGKRFCQTRCSWLENMQVAECVLEMWPHVQ